ncbi:relaxin receptor 1-like [Penaeus chinensis]|uniref:relaxin receptor 1-like n=1 Tax=Penaeus chinensis TaxID=139456 RepID=UPI001FB6CA97|nr:relaxin receptor 1-like [Penaeus chinensis]
MICTVQIVPTTNCSKGMQEAQVKNGRLQYLDSSPKVLSTCFPSKTRLMLTKCVKLSLKTGLEVSHARSCELGWFSCGENGTQCIEQRFLCNQEEECPDGEDEVGCVDDKGDNQVVKKILSKAVFPWHDRHRCSLTKYPGACVCRKLTMLHCPGIGILEVPQDIDPTVTALLFQNNSISLARDCFSRYPRLTLLFEAKVLQTMIPLNPFSSLISHLESNNLTQLPDGAFLGLNHLRRLFLMNNALRKLTPDALEGLTSLVDLDLTTNLVSDFDSLMSHLPKLESLLFTVISNVNMITPITGTSITWLNHNQITLEKRSASPRSRHLLELSLENNLIKKLTKDSLRGLTGLTSLYLRHNQIRSIDSGAFLQQRRLLDLELNYNLLSHLADEMFTGLKSLVSLNLDGNPLQILEVATLSALPSLASLRLTGMDLQEQLLVNISSGLGLQTAPNLSHIYTLRFRYCGHFPTVPDCHPKTDGVSSFEHLLVRVELRVAVWLVAFLTLLGNVTVLGGRGLARGDNKLLSLFIRNLAVADLLTGLYLLVVAVKDQEFRAEYHEHAYYWMTSWECTITGVLAMTSAEVSVLVLAFMSVERWLCIAWPLRSPRLSLRSARSVLAGIWALGLLLALAPVMYYRSKQGFYGTNGLCFPLHLDDPWVPGWLYSALVFVGINQVGVVLILLAYTGMFMSIRLTRGSTPLNQGDREFALRFFFIVFTDCLCWTPIIVLRVLALAGVAISHLCGSIGIVSDSHVEGSRSILKIISPFYLFRGFVKQANLTPVPGSCFDLEIAFSHSNLLILALTDCVESIDQILVIRGIKDL